MTIVLLAILIIAAIVLIVMIGLNSSKKNDRFVHSYLIECKNNDSMLFFFRLKPINIYRL